ncbi:hypothetical protein GYMLUDRAFT_33552 [Collybiopsis luxurians FD-317 M1]|nr:hypothetical protein GYMLUDRAFT_33552 [Collybiopsis luxurians FD-317 M1]
MNQFDFLGEWNDICCSAIDVERPTWNAMRWDGYEEDEAMARNLERKAKRWSSGDG